MYVRPMNHQHQHPQPMPGPMPLQLPVAAPGPSNSHPQQTSQMFLSATQIPNRVNTFKLSRTGWTGGFVTLNVVTTDSGTTVQLLLTDSGQNCIKISLQNTSTPMKVIMLIKDMSTNRSRFYTWFGAKEEMRPYFPQHGNHHYCTFYLFTEQNDGTNQSSNFVNNILPFLETGEFGDFEIRVKSRTFCVAKQLICAQSEYFAAMLRANMKEKSDQRCVIDDVDPDEFYEVLKFVYTGQIQGSFVDALYILAGRFQISALTERCEALLLSQLNQTTAPRIVKLVAIYSESDRFLNTVLTELDSQAAWRFLRGFTETST